MVHMARLAAVLGLAVTVGCPLSASALTADPRSQAPPPEAVPQAGQTPGSGSSEPLGDRLERSNGVIRPPTGVDPGLTQPPPRTGSRTPIIRPPGTSGGRSSLNPK